MVILNSRGIVPKLFVCWHKKVVDHVLRHTDQSNVVEAMSSGITGICETGNDLFFWR